MLPAFYQSLGRDAAVAYRFDKHGCATLSKQKLTACFDRGGAHFAGAQQTLSLRLTAFGRERNLASIAAASPDIQGNHVRYDYGNLSEWWRVLPSGLEQGFTVATRPGGHGKLVLALAVNQKAKQHEGALEWGKLRYGHLVVTDAQGTIVPTTLETRDDRVIIAINDGHAVYPLTVDPLVWLEQKVAATNGMAFDNFGWSVAVDGATALVGARILPTDDRPGAAYVFRNSGGRWTQTAKLSADDGVAHDEFGLAVALSGSTALIGASGAAYVFSYLDGNWTQTAKLTADDGSVYDFFGAPVALDGAIALVGAEDAIVNGNNLQGAAYVFSNSGGDWTQTAKLTADDGVENDHFGAAVALSGTTALIGAPFATSTGSSGGAAYLFGDSGGSWTQTAKLTADDRARYDEFGAALALAGPTALVGAPNATVNGNFAQGAAYVFGDSGGSWAQMAKLTADDGTEYAKFGAALALSGTTALVGAFPAAYVFDGSEGSWTQTQKLIASDKPMADFGDSVALDGTTAIVGAPWVAINGKEMQGAVYFESESNLELIMSAPETIDPGQMYISQAIVTNDASAASPAVAVTVAVPAAASFVSATANQGNCHERSNSVICKFGQIAGNAGIATANVTLRATGTAGDTIDNTASVAKAEPSLTADSPTAIITCDVCPNGYTEYDGNLTPNAMAHSPAYRAPEGQENAILTAPPGFQLSAAYESDGLGRHVYRLPRNEVHREAPAGRFAWIVKAGSGGGAYALCIKHP